MVKDKDLFSSFPVNLLTDRQINRQTNVGHHVTSLAEVINNTFDMYSVKRSGVGELSETDISLSQTDIGQHWDL